MTTASGPRLAEAEPGAGSAGVLTGVRVVVTGASSGLGAHVVRLLVGRGALVVGAARRADRLAALATEVADGPGRLVTCPTDVTDDDQVRRLVATAELELSGIDALVNNAGSETQGPIESLPDSAFDSMLAANVRSVFLCTRAALPALRRSRGMVVNVGSTVVSRPPRGRFGYVASKGAVEAMSRALAVDLGADQIRVNVIRPGIIPSELRGLTEAAERARFETGITFGKQALKIVGNGLDVAEAVAWLVGPGGRWVTRAVIDVDGGYVLGLADLA
ncbi:MAG TPA: SDR family oxidoreductase [Candidatus Limnocylindrales bacterium]|nr:SDR family oxidoreductase [Candidatus Limnocylindrales bacterium]